MSAKRPPIGFVKGVASGRIQMAPGADVSFGDERLEEKRKRRDRRAKNKQAKRARKRNR